jgi:hypothetical protein
MFSTRSQYESSPSYTLSQLRRVNKYIRIDCNIGGSGVGGGGSGGIGGGGGAVERMNRSYRRIRRFDFKFFK